MEVLEKIKKIEQKGKKPQKILEQEISFYCQSLALSKYCLIFKLQTLMKCHIVALLQYLKQIIGSVI